MRWIRLLCFSASLLFLPHFLKHDFKVPPSFEQIGFNPDWETAPPSPPIQSILNQPFTYLAHGNQSTVFVSEDGKYVLKLFRYTRSLFPIIEQMKGLFAEWNGKKAKNDLFTKMRKTFLAAKIAHTEAQAFTQVLFCHLNLTENTLPIVEIKAHRTYQLPLDRYRFVIQRKALPFKEALLSAKNDPIQMHQLLDSLLQLIQDRSALGIRNSDPNLAPNFGFLDGKAVEIDFGNYRKAAQTPTEIESYIQRLEQWLSKNAPEYISYTKEKKSF